MNLFYANGTPIINSFKVLSELPLDPRLYVQDLIERDSLVTNHIAYDGMRVWVKTTNKIYQYDKDHNTWTEIGEFTADDVEKLNNIVDYLIDTEHVYGVDNKLIFRERVYNPADDTTDIRDYIIDEARVENGELYNGLISKFFINRLNNITGYITESEFTTKQNDANLYHTITHYNPDDDTETIEDINIPTATDVNNGLLSNIQNIKLNRIEDYVNDIDLIHTNLDSVGLQYSYKVYNPNTDQTTNYDIVIPLVKDTENGLMSNIQHIKLGRIIDYMTEFGTYNNNASGLNYVYKTYNPNTDVTEDHNVLIPLSQHDLNGLLSSVDKIKLDDIVRIVTDIYLYTSFTDTEAIGLQYSVTDPNTQTDTTVEIEIPLVTDTKNGLVSPARKHWMDNADGLSNTGTTSDTWQLSKTDIDTKLDTAGGVIIKDVDGDLAVRNASDTDYEDILVKNITASGDTNITGDISVGGNADITRNTSIGGNTDITGTLTVDNTTTLNGQTTVNNNLTVTGTSNLQGNVDIDSNLNVDGTTNLVGDVTLQNNLTVDKNITSDSVYTDTLKVNTITSDGDITINKEINTSGIVNNGSITNTGAINNTGNVNITGNLTVSDNITSDTITTGTITVDQIVSTGTDIVFDKPINTVGINNTGALNNTGDVTITGDVDVTGVINATGNIETPLDITARNITATNNLTVQGDTLLEDTTVNNLVIQGNVTQQGQSFITEAETVEVKDNMLTLNNGETGAGVTAGQAGIEIDRGTSNPFFFVFNEDSDRFEVGTSGDLQPVMLRDTEANLTDTNILVWDAANKRAITSNFNLSNVTQLKPLATNGSGDGYLITGVSGDTITGRKLVVGDINGFTSPWFATSIRLFARAGTGGWARSLSIRNEESATIDCSFGGYGQGSDTINYAYVSAGTNDYNSTEILKVYPDNITFGDKTLAVWGTTSTYDTYHLHRRYLTINGTQYSIVGTANSDISQAIYTPADAGSNGQILQSDGTSTPKWVTKSEYMTRWPKWSEISEKPKAFESIGNFTGNRAVITDANGVLASSPITNTELLALDGISTSQTIQAQLNSKLSLSGGSMTGPINLNWDALYSSGGTYRILFYNASEMWFGNPQYKGVWETSNTDLLHRKNDVNYTIYDSSNFVAGTDFVVPSTLNSYLPLSAGSGKALTGMLYAPNRIALTADGSIFLDQIEGLYPWINGGHNEIIISGADHMIVNYRTPSNNAIPTSWTWRAGTSSSLADFTIGDLNTTGVINSGNLSNNGTANIAGLITAQSGIQIGTTSDIGWYYYNSRICAGLNVDRGVSVGNLLVSSAWGDASKIPDNGIYAKGSIQSGKGFHVVIGRASDLNFDLTAFDMHLATFASGAINSPGTDSISGLSVNDGWTQTFFWDSATYAVQLALDIDGSGIAYRSYNPSTGTNRTSWKFLATTEWVNDQLASAGSNINFSTSGSGTGYLVTGASGNTVTGRRLTVSDINNFVNPRFDDNLYLNVAGSGTTGGWARGYYLSNKEGDTDYVTFGAYGESSTTKYAYVIAGGQEFNDSEILKVYPTNITFGNEPLAVWGDSSASAYDTYKLYRRSLVINGSDWTVLSTTNATIPKFYAPTGPGSNGQILQSDGTSVPKWVNKSVTIAQVSGLQNALDAKADSDDLSSYMPKSGGRFTGPISFQGSSLSESTSLTSFLGVSTFASGGRVYYISATDLRTAIGAASTSHTHTYIVGQYGGSGGVIAPSAVGTNKLCCKMMYDNPSVNGGGYCDWILMNAYTWSDVPYATAIGVSKKATPAAYIMSGPNSSDKSTWVRKQLATTDMIPSLSGYATQEWVNQQISGLGGGTITSVSGSGASPLTLDISTSSSGAVTILGAISDASDGNAGVVTIGTQTFAGNKTFKGQITSSTIVPRSNNSYNIGSSSNKYANIYATTFTGNLVGNASSATTATTANSATTASTATTATTATKLSTTSAGSLTNPVYFANGIPHAGTYSFWTGTAAQYEALPSKSNTTIYFVTD